MPAQPLPLPLAEVAEPVRFHSRILDEDLWIVPDGYAGPPLPGSVYSVSECQLLVALAPGRAELEAIHRARAILDAEVVADADHGVARQTYLEAMARYRRLERTLAADAGEAEAADLLDAARTLSDLMNQTGGP
ncbi:MAG: hypothetical protein ABIL09_17245 [Gemmatimonadota bacterium]